MYDSLARVTNFLIRLVPAAVLAGAILAVLVVAFLLLHYFAHLF